VPEEYYYDFSTLWSWGQETISFRRSKKCAYRESVARFALASGLRYTGAMSISYPKHQINEIIKFRQGYKMQRDNILEPKQQGWELRSIKELQKLARVHLSRIHFIMLVKLACQTNLQMTVIIIQRIQNDRLRVFPDRVFRGDIVPSDTAGGISIMSLLFTFGTEMHDFISVVCIFLLVRKAVTETLKKVGSDGATYAVDDFISDESKIIERIKYSGTDLQNSYESARKKVCQMLFMTIISMWLIGYALLKWCMALTCEYGAWELQTGCLQLKGKASG